MRVIIDNIRISGIAAVVPPKSVSLDTYNDVFGEKKIKRIKRSTGVEAVHVVENGVTAADLCCDAAKKLFAEVKIDPATIDAIIFSSISPDYKAPATSIILQNRLGLTKESVAMDLTFGCSGFVYGLYQAAMLLKAGGCKRVLLCAGDTQSLMVNEKDRSMKMLVGDAGSVSGFWKTIEQFFNSKYVIFEFKNYREQITQREIYTTEKYLYLKALRGVAIIISCYGTDNNAEKAIRGTLRENGKLILSVNNQGLIEMIEAKNKGREPSSFLYDQLDTLLVELEK